MTPKEKADKLFFRFNAETIMQQPYEHETHMEKARQSAIICCEEIIKEHCHGSEHKEPNVQDRWIDFWQDVKIELENYNQ